MGSHDLLHGIHVYFKELGLSVATFLRWPKILSFMIFGLPQVHKPLGWYSSWALRKSGQILQAITQAIKICYDNPYPAGSGREIPSCTLVVNLRAHNKTCAFTFTTLVHKCLHILSKYPAEGERGQAQLKLVEKIPHSGMWYGVCASSRSIFIFMTSSKIANICQKESCRTKKR